MEVPKVVSDKVKNEMSGFGPLKKHLRSIRMTNFSVCRFFELEKMTAEHCQYH